jgi:UDP-N-acetylglucosamine 2-epimerase (non-hydrolysing)
MIKILTVIGTRPEAIKLAPVLQAFSRHSGSIDSRVCVTAQHRELMDQVLGRFGLQVHHDLDIMAPGQTPSDVAAAILIGMQPVLAREQPDWVVVQGDTTTAAMAALAAAGGGFRVAHVEAGLRTFDRSQPFPEELNRCLIAQMADLHLAPTPRARDNLLAEGIAAGQILVVGNTGIDALFDTVAELRPQALPPPLAALPADARVVLATAHRRENLGEPLARICAALRDIAALDERIHVVYPLHPRPEIRLVGRRLLAAAPRVVLCPPLEHPDLVRLMLRSELVITDSGGMQEEAPTLGRPVLVLREVTERPEAIEAGAARLVGTDRAGIVAAARHFLEGGFATAHRSEPPQIYGDGRAAERIAAALQGESVKPWVPMISVAGRR